jgi:hypothetical protein
MEKSVLEEAGLYVEDGQATQKMEESIYKMAQLLLCPLCDKVSGWGGGKFDG